MKEVRKLRILLISTGRDIRTIVAGGSGQKLFSQDRKQAQELYQSVFKKFLMALIETNGPAALGLAAVIGILFMLVGGATYAVNANAISNAETTEATVVATEIGESVSPDSVGKNYYPVVFYNYTVDGQEYEGSNLRSGSGRQVGGRFWAEDIVDEYEVGEAITVHYTPSDPSNSFIKNSMPLYPYGLIVFGLLFFLPAVYMLRPYFGLIDDD